MNKLQVTIGSNEYILKSARPNNQMKEIVDYVREKVEETSRPPLVNPTMQATLAAINIADELFELRASFEERVKEEVNKARISSSIKRSDLEALQKKLQEAERQIREISRQFDSFQKGRR